MADLNDHNSEHIATGRHTTSEKITAGKSSGPARPLLLDCDTGIDDSLALLYLLSRPEVSLVSVVSTAGNVPVDVVAANNLAWLCLVGRADIPVYVGSAEPLVEPLRTTEDTHGPHGVGYAALPPAFTPPAAQDAATAWIDASLTHPGELIGLVTGPSTSLSRAITRDPGLPARLAGLVIMGGTFLHPGNTAPTVEWNVAVDPESLAHVLVSFGHGGAPAPVICPLDLTEQAVFTPAHLSRLAELANSQPVERPSAGDTRGAASVASNPVVRHLVDALRFYFEFHADHDEGYIAHAHDPFAAAVAIGAADVTTRSACVDVELRGTLTRATTVADDRGFWGRPDNASIATAADMDAFLDDLVESIARLANAVGQT
ncbi:nucleoside hydrolase [Gordonia jinhuaensis]|uniref:Nucleoside hydrolase n=1 Tax=Gordonia jinhuaensis TaxID=1517702 RepID=A0A916T044_9ACTN|nr:nucleoside hydrolase [Gordonia jinhuaensis]